LLSLCVCAAAWADKEPNIVLIMAKDISTELACYGHPAVKTPVLDALAAEGARYTHAFCTAPSCTPSRNAMMTGVYQTRTDTQDQRRRGIVLPEGMKPITHLLQEAGYYTANSCGYHGKTDLNFKVKYLFDGPDWKRRKAGQPFFAQTTLLITHRKDNNHKKITHDNMSWAIAREKSDNPVNPDEVELPPYFPDHPAVRMDWATYLDAMQKADSLVGEILDRLEEEGIADNTVVIFIGDNGRCHLRGKCWLYDAGLRVPLIIRWPGRIEPNTVSDDMVSMIDVSATILDIAGVELPTYLDGHPILGPRAQTRDHIFAARDKIDNVRDVIRCVRTKRFKYIRNYKPELGYRECGYVQKHRPMLSVIKKLDAQGKLTAAQKLILATTKPKEEFYDLQSDPHEVTNLLARRSLQGEGGIGAAEHRATIARLRGLLDGWIADTKDTGLARMKHGSGAK